jgi:hypothetical protein
VAGNVALALVYLPPAPGVAPGVSRTALRRLRSDDVCRRRAQLLESGAQSVWEEKNRQPAPDEPLVVALGQELKRVMDLIKKHDLCVPAIQRWLQPVALPQLERARTGSSFPTARVMDKSAVAVTSSILGMRAAIGQVLDMAGHANGAAAWCSVADPPHAVGFEAVPVFAAAFAQVAGGRPSSMPEVPSFGRR